MQEQKQVIISLTSFPAAISYAIQAVKSILEGIVLPDKIVLYLTFSQFGESGIPMELQELVKNNPVFEIRNYDDDIRSYRKLVPALNDFPDAVIVTIDDDVWYNKNMLHRLLYLHNRYPNAIVGHRVREYKPNAPYRSWKKYKGHRYLLKSLKPKFTNIQTGVGGVLYPPDSLDTKMLDSKIFMEMAPTVDDIWFWAAAVAKGTKIAPVPFGYFKLNELKKPKEISLFNINGNSAKDVNRIVLEKILEKYPRIKENVESEIKTGKKILFC